MSAQDLVEAFVHHGVSTVVYLPDSWLAATIRLVAGAPELRAVPVSREEEGVAVCCGLSLTRRRSVLLLQNAGLLSAGNTIVTLSVSYSLPILMCIAYRGSARDPSFYQIPKGRVTEPILAGLHVPYALVDATDLRGQVGDALKYAEMLPGPYALLFQEGSLG